MTIVRYGQLPTKRGLLRSGSGNFFSANIERSKTRSKKKLTTNAGAPVPDNQNVLTAGPSGPQLLQDVWFLEKLAHFDREVIPERRMHTMGSGAYHHSG